MKYEILLVDDEIDNVDALERLFRKSYTVHKATSGKQALEILRQNPHIALILSDQRMHEMTGVELLKKSIKTHPDTLRILLTGYTDIESIVSSINKGEVYRYLNKPWDPVDLKNTIDKAIEKFKLRQELVEKNQKLQVALNELKSLDQAKTNFMILINHELKTPLTVMTSFLDLLKESSLDEEQSMFVDRIDKSRQRLQNMINATLELVSAETGQMKVNKKSVSTQKLASEIEHQFLQLNNKQQLTFVSQVEDSKVKIDSELIKSVVYKLLENAVKFAHKESQVELQIFSKDSHTLLAIKNSGPELSKTTLEKILKPFALDENIMNHTQGLGLGLSTSQALLKLHGSALHIESHKGQVVVQFALEWSNPDELRTKLRYLSNDLPLNQ